MKKLLLLLLTLFTTMGTWATSYYFVGGRTSASDLTTGKKYMIYNTARRYFLSASGSAYGLTTNNAPLTFTSTNDNFVWTLEEGSASGTYKIKNIGTSTYSHGGNSLGEAVDYTIAEYSTCPNKGGMPSYNDDGSTTEAANITAADNAVYIKNTSSSQYFNGSGSAFAETGAAHVYILYEVIEIVDGGCYTIDFESNDGTKFWALSSSSTTVSVAQQTTAAQGSVFVAHAYVNAQGQQRWIFVNNSDGYFLSYKTATATFGTTKGNNEFSVAAIYKGVNNNVTSTNCNGKVYITTDARSSSDDTDGCYILQESSATFNVSPAISTTPFYNGSYTSAMKFTPNAASASATATLAIAKFNALYQVKDVVACATNISALFDDPETLIDDINAAATAEAATSLATTYMKSAEGKKFYAVCSGATGQYLNIGTSVVSATSTELTAEAVMELEYAGYGKYYIKGVKSGYYSNVPVANNAAPTTTSNKAVAGSFFIGNYANTTDNKVYFAKYKLKGGNTVAFHYSTSYTYRTCGWGIDAGNSQWNITYISDDDYDVLANVSAVTYNVILEANGTVKATTTKDVRKGHDLVIPSEIAKDYCTYTYYSDAACTSEMTVVPDAATTTVYALASYTMPFTVSSDFASATWYYATLRGKYLRADDDHKDDSGRYQTNSTNEHTDAYKWAFFGGNPYDGFYVMNKNQGDSKYLYKGTSQLEFQSGITPTEDNNALFAVTPNSNGGFTLRNIAGGSTWYINDAGNGGNLGFWNSGSGANDGGSNWVIYEDVIGALSNSKKYTITCNRGSLSTYTDEGTTYLASSCKTSLGVEGKEFAILSYGGRYYLYSVSDGKFVTHDGTDELKAPLRTEVTGTVDAVAFEIVSNKVYAIKFNNDEEKYFNSSNSDSYTYGIIFNDWGGSGYWDNGNQYVIEEAGDFDDYETAFNALKTKIDGQAAIFATNITALKAINWSDEGKAGQLNRYNFIDSFVGYAGNEESIITGLESAGYTSENLQSVQAMNQKGISYALNLPATGKFYRIKGYSNNYITSNTASSNASMNGTASANNIVYYSADKNLIFFGSGYGLYNTSIVAPAGSILNTYTFSEGAQSSHYYIKSNATGIGTYCYDNTSIGTKLDRNTNPVTSGSYQTDWTLEEVTSLPVTHTNSFTSFSAPVAVTIPDDCDAYTATNKDGSAIKLTKVEGNIAANTGLIIGTTDDSAIDFSFAIYTGDELTSTSGNILSDNKVATPLSRTDNYFFGKQKSTGNYIFTKLSGTGDNYTLPGFKAYLKAEDIPAASDDARLAIIWGDDDPTGISELNDESIALGDGKYYQDGKVVVVRNGVKYNVAGQIIK